MNEPVLAAPLDEAEKQEIFGNLLADATGLKLLTRYVEVFLSKNHLQGYETSEISKRKLAASFVLAAAAFLEIVFFALYHNLYIFILFQLLQFFGNLLHSLYVYILFASYLYIFNY